MRLQSFTRVSNTWRVGLIVLAIVVSLIAGASLLVYDSPLTPLIAGGVVAAMGISIAWLRKPVWALYAAILVVFLPTGLVPGSIQSLLNRLTLVLALGVWLLDAVTRRRRIVWTSTTLLMLGFLIWAIVTLLWAPNSSLATEKTAQYASRMGLFLLLVANEIDSRETLDGLMNTLALNGWVLVIAGIGLVMAWTGEGMFQGHQSRTSVQVLETNVNAYGVSLLITMPGILWQAMGSSGRQRALGTVLGAIYVLLTSLLITLGGSRGGVISLIATMLAFWFCKPTRPWGTLGLLTLAVAVISTPFIFSTVAGRFYEAEGGMLGGRMTIWQAAWQLIREHPWTGVGIGNANQAVMSHLRTFTSLEGRMQRSIHNPVLQIWAETGLAGILLYLSVLGSAIWSFVRQYRQYRGKSMRSLTSYFALVSCTFVGIILSWIEGGGMEHASSYFLLLALLLIPSHLDVGRMDGTTEK